MGFLPQLTRFASVNMRASAGEVASPQMIECGEEAAKHFAFDEGYINLNHGSSADATPWTVTTDSSRLIRHTSHQGQNSPPPVSGTGRSKTRYVRPIRIPRTSARRSKTGHRRLCACSSGYLRLGAQREHWNRYCVTKHGLGAV